jgi:hypothetical protein
MATTCHQWSESPEVLPNRINIDTGAFMTGRLTCAVLDKGRPRFSPPNQDAPGAFRRHRSILFLETADAPIIPQTVLRSSLHDAGATLAKVIITLT